MIYPKSRFPIRSIVFDEVELIISQGSTLLTASLVLSFIKSSSNGVHSYYRDASNGNKMIAVMCDICKSSNNVS